MVLAIILLVSGQLLAGIVGVFYVKRLRKKAFGVLNEYYHAICDKKDKETPSILEETVDNIAQIFALRMYTTLQSRAMATKSQISRQAGLIAEDMVADQANAANPFLGMFLDQFPSVKKRLAKNPTAVQAILPMLDGILAGGG